MHPISEHVKLVDNEDGQCYSLKKSKSCAQDRPISPRSFVCKFNLLSIYILRLPLFDCFSQPLISGRIRQSRDNSIRLSWLEKIINRSTTSSTFLHKFL